MLIPGRMNTLSDNPTGGVYVDTDTEVYKVNELCELTSDVSWGVSRVLQHGTSGNRYYATYYLQQSEYPWYKPLNLMSNKFFPADGVSEIFASKGYRPICDRFTKIELGHGHIESTIYWKDNSFRVKYKTESNPYPDVYPDTSDDKIITSSGTRSLYFAMQLAGGSGGHSFPNSFAVWSSVGAGGGGSGSTVFCNITLNKSCASAESLCTFGGFYDGGFNGGLAFYSGSTYDDHTYIQMGAGNDGICINDGGMSAGGGSRSGKGGYITDKGNYLGKTYNITDGMSSAVIGTITIVSCIDGRDGLRYGDGNAGTRCDYDLFQWDFGQLKKDYWNYGSSGSVSASGKEQGGGGGAPSAFGGGLTGGDAKMSNTGYWSAGSGAGGGGAGGMAGIFASGYLRGKPGGPHCLVFYNR